MPAYRVEVSPNNRAGCQDAVCKKNGVKIMKGEIRFGVWVEGTSGGGHEFQSWRWRHWGCVSGKTLQNIRENLTGALADGGDYQWDNMDGLEDMPPDYQEKIKLAVTEGKIADEDWKGDPAYNVLGKTGIRGRATPKKKEPEEGEQGTEIVSEAETPVKPVAKKRGRAKDKDEDEDAKVVKKRATKAKKEDEDGGDAKPARKSVKNEDEDEEESKLKQKPRALKVAVKKEEIHNAESMKKEQNDETDVEMKPAKKSRAKKLPKLNEDEEVIGVKTKETNEATTDVKPIRKARGRPVTKEESDAKSQVKMEVSEDVNVNFKPAKNIKSKKITRMGVADGGRFAKKEENDCDVQKVKSISKHDKHEEVNGMKKEEEQDAKVDAQENPLNASENAEDNYNSKMPEDPLERIALAFCDREGPLVGDFNEMVEAQEVAGDDWDGFLQKTFQSMVDAGKVADDDFNGFLQKMYEREVAFRERASVSTKKGRKGKTADTTAAKSRVRRGKAS